MQRELPAPSFFILPPPASYLTADRSCSLQFERKSALQQVVGTHLQGASIVAAKPHTQKHTVRQHGHFRVHVTRQQSCHHHHHLGRGLLRFTWNAKDTEHRIRGHRSATSQPDMPRARHVTAGCVCAEPDQPKEIRAHCGSRSLP